ncbi:MAG: polyphosphate kinase 1 [Acidobacteriota bacterium]
MTNQQDTAAETTLSESSSAAPTASTEARPEPFVESSEGSETSAPEIDPQLCYLNRELSWLRFNSRVLEEALDESHPLLERLKFLAIYASNLDEFFMIRVSGLRRQLEKGVAVAPPDGRTPRQQLSAIREYLLPELEVVENCFASDLLPRLAEQNISVVPLASLKSKKRKRLRRFFEEEIFPMLTPLAIDPGHPFPHISNLSLNLAVEVRDKDGDVKLARVKIPQSLDRFIPVPAKVSDDEDEAFLTEDPGHEFVALEEVIADNLGFLFPGLEVGDYYTFRVTRDADFEIEEDEAADLLTTMVEVVGKRHFGFAVRLEIDDRMPRETRKILISHLGLKSYQVYKSSGLLALSSLWQIANLDVPELRDPPFQSHARPSLGGDEGAWAAIREQDRLLYHPYDSFNPVVDFIRGAARDPKVVAIKQTLYRAGKDSPIVEALMEARENGKQVAVLVELKARFDEENNIGWARALEDAGVHVVYGLVGLKTHAKMCLVVRRERAGLLSYVHIGTGNYNPVTARLYTDIGYFTADQAIAREVLDLFNSLTGYWRDEEYDHLLVAPGSLRDQFLERIEREIEVHQRSGDGQLAFKMNALVDRACIDALYRASQAGVQVDLQVRGICCLRPGVPGLSENIRVTSLVGRFLEHTRVYYFRNGGDEEILIGSADLMPRNLDHRVEVLLPIRDRQLLRALRDDILFRHLDDVVASRELQPDGEYAPKAESEGGLGSQGELLLAEGLWRRDAKGPDDGLRGRGSALLEPSS